MKIESFIDEKKDPYIGTTADNLEMWPYLTKLSNILKPTLYNTCVSNQRQRDGSNRFIMIIISPDEIKKICKFKKIKFEEILKEVKKRLFFSQYRICGMGKVKKQELETYCVLCRWPEANSARKDLGLNPINHYYFTLGFNPKDEHGPRILNL